MDEVFNEESKVWKQLITRVAHSPQYYNNYKILLDFWSLIEISNEMIIKLMIKKHTRNYEESKQCKEQQTKYHNLLESIHEIIRYKVILRDLNCWIINFISSLFVPDKLIIRVILYSMEKQKIIEESGKENTKYPYRITNNRISEAKRFLELNRQNKITILKLRKYLEDSTNLKVLSSTGTRYMLKNILKYTYKRISNINTKTLSFEKIRLFCETNYIQEFLEVKGYRLIWVDEFHSNMSHIRGYKISHERVFKAILLIIPSRNAINFTIAIDDNQVLLI